MLHERGVLTRESIPEGYSYACHPILRDHFRAVLLGTGASVAKRAADEILSGRPSGERPRNAEEVESILLSIELLLNAGEFPAADELYRLKLEDGRLCKWIPALPEGLRCALDFVVDESRRLQCQERLSQTRMRHYLNEVGLFASLSGNYELAARSYTDKLDLARKMGDALSFVIGLQNESILSVRLGDLETAAAQAAEALSIACDLIDRTEVRSGNAYCSWPQVLLGRVSEASEHSAIANIIDKSYYRIVFDPFIILHAELLIRAGYSALAARQLSRNIRFCERHLLDHRARCHWLLGACALAEGQIYEAKTELSLAEPVFHSGQMIFDLARLHVTAGSIAVAQRHVATALHRAEEALALAQPRGMRLVHADALVLRGRARLLETAPDRALDDAEDALRLARDCGYAWAERDALLLQAKAHTVLGHRDTAHRARGEADALSARLRLTEEDLAEADAKTEAWLQKWERENAKTQ